MKNIASKPLLNLLGGALLLLTTLAHAQYSWIDDKGTRHFSDRPPPPSTPADKILKAPGKPQLAEEPAVADAPATVEAPKATARPTLADREADYRKRTQERAKEEGKGAEEAATRRAQAENCASARQYQAQLESGIRIAETDAQGERSFISDEERARRLNKVRANLAECGK